MEKPTSVNPEEIQEEVLDKIFGRAYDAAIARGTTPEYALWAAGVVMSVEAQKLFGAPAVPGTPDIRNDWQPAP